MSSCAAPVPLWLIFNENDFVDFFELTLALARALNSVPICQSKSANHGFVAFPRSHTCPGRSQTECHYRRGIQLRQTHQRQRVCPGRIVSTFFLFADTKKNRPISLPPHWKKYFHSYTLSPRFHWTPFLTPHNQPSLPTPQLRPVVRTLQSLGTGIRSSGQYSQHPHT